MSDVVFLFHGNINAKTGASMYLRNLLNFKGERSWIVSDRTGIHKNVESYINHGSRGVNFDSLPGNILFDVLKVFYRHVYGALLSFLHALPQIKGAKAIYCTDIWTFFILSLFMPKRETALLAFHNNGIWSEMFMAAYPRLDFARSLIEFFERYVSRKALARIYLSNTACENSIRFNPNLPGKGIVLYNGIPEYKSGALGEFEYDFVMIGTVCERKGQKYMIEAIRVLSNSKERCPQVAIIGGGPDLLELKNMVEEYSLQEHIHFLGPLEDPWKMRARYKSLLFLSSIEGMPLVILEALRAGLPVLYYSLDVLEEILDESVSMKCHSRDSNELAATISEYLRNETKLYPKMSHDCRALYLSRFTLENHMKSLDIIFSKL